MGQYDHFSIQTDTRNLFKSCLSGDIGGETVTATRNMMFDVIKPIAGTITPPGTTISTTMRTTSGRTLEQSETEFALTTASKQRTVDLNTDYYLTAPSIVASALSALSPVNTTEKIKSAKS